MGNPQLGVSTKNGEDMHYSVGALIKNAKDEYLLVDRKKEPLGMAGLAGHIDENESPVDALIREISEESSLKVKSYKLIFEEELIWSSCSRGIHVHLWYVYSCEVSGTAKLNKDEAKSMDWYSKKKISELRDQGKLEPVWDYWFNRLGFF